MCVLFEYVVCVCSSYIYMDRLLGCLMCVNVVLYVLCVYVCVCVCVVYVLCWFVNVWCVLCIYMFVLFVFACIYVVVVCYVFV